MNSPDILCTLLGLVRTHQSATTYCCLYHPSSKVKQCDFLNSQIEKSQTQIKISFKKHLGFKQYFISDWIDQVIISSILSSDKFDSQKGLYGLRRTTYFISVWHFYFEKIKTALKSKGTLRSGGVHETVLGSDFSAMCEEWQLN